MLNHVHVILVPDRKEALGRTLGEGRRRYSSTINARLVERAQNWPWSSVRALLDGGNDGLVEAAPLLAPAASRFADLLDGEDDADKLAALRVAEGVGRPLGSAAFLDRVAALAEACRGRPSD